MGIPIPDLRSLDVLKLDLHRVKSAQTSAPTKNCVSLSVYSIIKNKFQVKMLKLVQFLAQMSPLILNCVNPAYGTFF
jgi:hypothetical protein